LHHPTPSPPEPPPPSGAADDLKYLIALHRISGLGPVRFRLLEARFGSMFEAWRAAAPDLAAAGLDQRTVREIVAARPRIDPDAELEALDRAGVKAIPVRSPDYPGLLKETDDPPVILYVKGALLAGDEIAVAVVGTRGPTVYGREMARRLSAGLAEAGVTVLSGMARGIDGIAHTAALDAGGRTIAVLGGGLDRIYPAEHAPLSRRIAGAGALASEYALGMRPKAEHFPRRNRVISGMSLGVVVVEGDMKSGALLTVRHALDQNREVFAVPGSALSRKSEGANWLIQQGAKLVTNVSDILEELSIPGPGLQIRLDEAGPDGGTRRPRDPLHLELLERLAEGPMHVDGLTRATGFASGTVSSALAVMELKGFVQQVGPMQYAVAAHHGAGNPQRGG